MTERAPKTNYWLPVLLSVVGALGIWVGSAIFGSAENSNKELQKLNQIFEVLDQQYVDKINKEDIFEQTISEMLHKLDPHSNYIAAKDIIQIDEQTNAAFGGIGVRFLLFRDTICITHVNDKSPAFIGGLQRGDRIIEINSKKATGKSITNEEVMSRLKGAPKTKVNVTILRKGKKYYKTLVRNTIPIATVPCSYMIRPSVGYVQISQFSVPTADEFHRAALSLLKKGMKNLVLDLRGNGGGTMDAAIQIADEFLPKGYLILSSKGQHSKETFYRATNAGILEKTKVVVLIDAQSASASEILAGALQDNDRATIVGRRSYGKGLIQQDRRLNDGSNLRITVARYYTPSGRSIQRPYNKGYEAYQEDEQKSFTEEYFKPDSSIFVDSLRFKTRNGRTVYGGGGIMPDIFVPGDTSKNSLYLSELRWNGVFNAFVFDYLNRKTINYRLDEFNKKFIVDQFLLNQFVAFASREFGIQYQQNEYLHSKEKIVLLLKAEIARHLYLEEGYYQIINNQDVELKRALALF